MQHRISLKSSVSRSLPSKMRTIFYLPPSRNCGSSSRVWTAWYRNTIKTLNWCKYRPGCLIVDDDNGSRTTVRRANRKAMTHFHISLLSSASIEFNLCLCQSQTVSVFNFRVTRHQLQIVREMCAGLLWEGKFNILDEGRSRESEECKLVGELMKLFGTLLEIHWGSLVVNFIKMRLILKEFEKWFYKSSKMNLKKFD